MPEPSPADIAAAIRADDDQASAEARSDALAVVRFYTILTEAGLPDELVSELTGSWMDAYLDTSSLDD